MEMEIGALIKMTRINKGMTQEELAEGIASMSYLSKIENEHATASSEVINMLCTRLGIQLDKRNDETIDETLQTWYGMLFEGTDKENIIALYNKLQQIIDSNYTDEVIMFEIHKVRYYIILEQYVKAFKQINKLNAMSNRFDTLHQYYWYKFKGNYYSLGSAEFNQALRLYKMAEEKLNQLDMSEEEIADLKYTIAITHSKLRNTLESIDYANTALDIYQRHYHFTRCAQCHIVLGISYRRIKMYDKSIKNQNLAKHLGKITQNKAIIQLANQNLGYLHSTKGEPREAIHYYEEVANDNDVKLIEKIAATTSLIKEYYHLEEYEKAEKMVEKSTELLEAKHQNEEHKYFYYVTYTYDFALKGDDENFEALLIEEFIPYLKKNKDYANLVIYTNLMANHFEKQGRYKEAANYYRLANINYNELVDV